MKTTSRRSLLGIAVAAVGAVGFKMTPKLTAAAKETKPCCSRCTCGCRSGLKCSCTKPEIYDWPNNIFPEGVSAHGTPLEISIDGEILHLGTDRGGKIIRVISGSNGLIQWLIFGVHHHGDTSAWPKGDLREYSIHNCHFTEITERGDVRVKSL